MLICCNILVFRILIKNTSTLLPSLIFGPSLFHSLPSAFFFLEFSILSTQLSVTVSLPTDFYISPFISSGSFIFFYSLLLLSSLFALHLLTYSQVSHSLLPLTGSACFHSPEALLSPSACLPMPPSHFATKMPCINLLVPTIHSLTTCHSLYHCLPPTPASWKGTQDWPLQLFFWISLPLIPYTHYL